MVQERRGEPLSLWAAVQSIAPQDWCVHSPCWNGAGVARLMAETGRYLHSGGQAYEELERENKALRRANDTLRAASAFSPKRSSTAN
jgi:hypothetical protein